MDVAQLSVMAEDENTKGNVQKDAGDIGKDDKTSFSDPEEKLDDASDNFRQEAKKMVDEDKKSPDTIPENKTKFETTPVERVQEKPVKVEKIRTGTSILLHRPIVVILIIGVIILGGVLLYTQYQLSNQSYKIENFNALWNKSLADLRSGNTTIDQYCINRVHDENLCNQFRNLQYMN
ncbi:MAG TPA: hypothetical protein VH797_08855 [Nitrososphaeraceae archaeon]|jgi:hypothetical protein